MRFIWKYGPTILIGLALLGAVIYFAARKEGCGCGGEQQAGGELRPL
jgi:hypothetical protein